MLCLKIEKSPRQEKNNGHGDLEITFVLLELTGILDEAVDIPVLPCSHSHLRPHAPEFLPIPVSSAYKSPSPSKVLVFQYKPARKVVYRFTVPLRQMRAFLSLRGSAEMIFDNLSR